MNYSTILGSISAIIIVITTLLGGLWLHTDAAAPPWSQRYGYFPGDDIDRYAGHAAVDTTPGGVRYDDEGQGLASRIDFVVDWVEACQLPVDRSTFVVYIPQEQGISCDGTQQVLPIVGLGGHPSKPDSSCVDGANGHYRAVVAKPNVIVATHSCYLLQDALLRFLVGSANPYEDSRIKPQCLLPVTGALD